MAAFNKFNSFTEAVMEKVHNLGSDALKIALTNVAPVATNTQLTDLTQIAGGTGYTTGGLALTITASSQTSGTYKLVGTDLVITATGVLGPVRYAVLFNDTATNKEVIGWWDYGSSITLGVSGELLTLDLDGTNGILQLV